MFFDHFDQFHTLASESRDKIMLLSVFSNGQNYFKFNSREKFKKIKAPKIQI
jgi:hypothetical protein